MNKRAKTNILASRAVAARDFLWSRLKDACGHWTDSLALTAGGLLFFVGAAEILGAFDPSQSLDLADPIFGISFRHLMLTVGIAQLAVSFILLFTNWKVRGLGVAAWVAANFLVFRIGLWNAGWHHAAGFMFGPIGFSAHTTDVLTSLLSVFLLVAFGVAFWKERRVENAARFAKAFCPACGGHRQISHAKPGPANRLPALQSSDGVAKSR